MMEIRRLVHFVLVIIILIIFTALYVEMNLSEALFNKPILLTYLNEFIFIDWQTKFTKIYDFPNENFIQHNFYN